MNSKHNQTTIERHLAENIKMRNSAQKLTPSCSPNKSLNLKNKSTDKKVQSPKTLNQTIEKVKLAIKQISIAPFVQNSLITSLNLYLNHLKNSFSVQTKVHNLPQINKQLKKPQRNEESHLFNNENKQNPIRFLSQQNKTKLIKKDKYNLQQSFKIKQNHSKLLLPQITQPIQKKKLQTRQNLDKFGKDHNSVTQSEKENILNDTVKEKKLLNKTPKSRFFQLKYHNNQEHSDQCLQHDEESAISPNLKFRNWDSRTQKKKNTKQQDSILQSLKQRLTQHKKLVGKLELKVQQFEVNKFGHQSSKVLNNPIQDQKIKLNQSQTQNKKKNGEQCQVLKSKLQQRQQELRNLWAVLLQQQSFIVSSPK